jgi:AcrR family transcriptional regulator
MQANTEKSELTRAAIIGAGLDVAAEFGIEAISLQAVADRVQMSKSGVFSRIGSREALQKAVIEEYGRRFHEAVFGPALKKPEGLPRLNEIMRLWFIRLRDVDVHTGCIFTAGAFELDDKECELREVLFAAVTHWRAVLRRTVKQAIDAGHLREDTDPMQLVVELNYLAIGLLHDARFLRDKHAADRALVSCERLIKSYQT